VEKGTFAYFCCRAKVWRPAGRDPPVFFDLLICQHKSSTFTSFDRHKTCQPMQRVAAMFWFGIFSANNYRQDPCTNDAASSLISSSLINYP